MQYKIMRLNIILYKFNPERRERLYICNVAVKNASSILLKFSLVTTAKGVLSVCKRNSKFQDYCIFFY
ncbi:hypothetical protein RIR_jg1162.t1 [Rhizophagus irregularis DAOM 181602=DAOM 197198]|nr:hypothetical protein RIR_jg1162.t1 [Rhizophagus irregularis DAOM 181602=DAOM 197198]